MKAAALLEQVESLRRAEPAAALRTLEAGFASAIRRADPSIRGLLWRTRAHVLRSLRRTRESAAAYVRAESAFATAGDPREQGRCMIGLVDALMYLGRYAQARTAAARGRRLLEHAGDRAALARLLNNEGNLWHRLDLPERALACYRDAVRELQRAGDARSALMIGTNVGNCLSLLGRCDEARRHYTLARRALETAGAHNEALSAGYNLAYLDFLEHHDEAALEGLERVRVEAESRGYPSLAALARLDRAEIFLRMGAHDEARGESLAAVIACTALDLRYETGKAEVFAALALHRLGQGAGARAGIERALKLFDREGNRIWTGEALLGLATLWWSDGNPRAAAALLSAAGRRFADAGDREREASAATLEARALLACGDRRAARARLERTTGRVGRRPSQRLRHLMLSARAQLARAEGDVVGARSLLTRAAREAERLAARILDEQWRATFWGEWGWPHQELASLELAEGRLAKALEALEAGRGRALVDTEQRRARGRELPASVRRWAASRQARERVRRADDSEAAPLTLAPPLALRRALEARAPRSVRASSIRSAVPAGALLIDFLVHDGRLGAITADRARLRGVAALVTEAHITRLVSALLFRLRSAAFRAEGARTQDPALQELLSEIAALTLWPLLGSTIPTGLAIAPSGPLTRLPWAALPLPDGRALCQAMPLVIVPGLRLGLSAASAARQPNSTPLVVGVDSGDLAAVERECAAVCAAFPAARTLVGAEATVERFAALAGAADWIHFAGHGGWRADAPHESGLRFADRWLLAGELADLPLRARFVTLSACHSARSLIRPGEEWFGLTRSFLLAGAAAVVASQWDVEDGATARLMSALYPLLAAGLPLAQALAAVQAECNETGAHPLEWAGFLTLGGPLQCLAASDVG